MSVLLLVLNAAQSCPTMITMFPEHVRDHYGYLRDSLPHLVPQLKVPRPRPAETGCRGARKGYVQRIEPIVEFAKGIGSQVEVISKKKKKKTMRPEQQQFYMGLSEKLNGSFSREIVQWGRSIGYVLPVCTWVFTVLRYSRNTMHRVVLVTIVANWSTKDLQASLCTNLLPHPV